MFAEKLTEYMNLLRISGKELAECSGISEATISRYKSAGRIPKPESEEIKKLCRGICIAAEKKYVDALSYETLLSEFNDILEESTFDFDSMQNKFNALCGVLAVNIAEISKSMRYDASYISRIRNGKRRPANPDKFAHDTAEYISRRYDGDADKRLVCELMSVDYECISSKDDYIKEIRKWLMSAENKEHIENPVEKFLEKLDDFDLNEYIKAIHFDKLKVPSLPFQLPTRRSYYGVEEMKHAEIDFLKATALSKSKQSVFMCSDMQMDDMAADIEFSKKYMFGIAAMLKKGLHLNIVHNLNRPFAELMYGFECWIPLYMTGQISPYYLKGINNKVFCHFLNVSGAAALSGESISGYHAKGKYYLTKNKDELAYYRERAECILKKAQPLMEIYRSDNKRGLHAFWLAEEKISGNRKNILSSLPIYTADDGFLADFLGARNVAEAETKSIMEYAKGRRRHMLEILGGNFVTDEVPYLDEKEFSRHKISLSLSGMFSGKDFEYTYEEYQRHMQLTKEFAAAHENYFVRNTRQNVFSNIQIMIHENECVMISKNKAPTIHFVIRHPILREAIEKLDFPVVEPEE